MRLPNAPTSHALKRFLMRCRRRIYFLREHIPSLREHHRREVMVGPLGFWKALQRYQMQVLLANGLKREHRFLDVGCGPLQGGVPLIKYLDRGCYTGVECDPVRVAAANGLIAEFKLGEKSPRVFRTDTFGEEDLGDESFDFIWASQLLMLTTVPTSEMLFEVVGRRLKPGGKFLADIFPLDHHEFRHPENAGRYTRHLPEELEARGAKHGLVMRPLGTIGQFGYPRRLTLKTNLLFEFTKPQAATR